MDDKTIKARIVNKHDVESAWNASNVKDTFIPKQGELIIYDKDDTHPYERVKVGDGNTAVGSLPFITDNITVDTSGLAKLNGGNTFKGEQKFTEPPSDGYSINASGYVKGSWLQASAISNKGSGTGKVCVFDNAGWVYYRTPAEILTEAGGAKASDISGKADLAGDNTFTGTNTFNKDVVIDGDSNSYDLQVKSIIGNDPSSGPIVSYTKYGFSNLKYLAPGSSKEYSLNYPSKSGTIALTSDIDVTAAGNNNFTGTNTFNRDVVVNDSALKIIDQDGQAEFTSRYIINSPGNATNSYYLSYPSKEGIIALTSDIVDVEANPTTSGTTELTKLKVGDTVYNVFSGFVVDTEVTQNSDNLITSGAVYSYIQSLDANEVKY